MKRLDIEVLVHPVLRSFTPEAGLLDAAERRGLDRNAPGVEPYHAALEPLSHPPGTADVFGVEVRGQPEWRSVRQRERFVFALEAEQRRNGADVSSFATFMSGLLPVSTVGCTNCLPRAWTAPPTVATAPRVVASSMCPSTLSTAAL